jgi:hypothetical protein
MSGTAPITGVSPDVTIYGTTAEGIAYITSMFGDAYTTWLALNTDNQNKTFVAARRFIDQQVWVEAADTFAERDALEAFHHASYELAAMIASDPDVIAVDDQGSNLQRVYAGGAGVDFFSPTSSARGTAPKLPPILMRLIGSYLASASTASASLGSQSGSCSNPFDACSDFDRKEPW